MEHTIMVRRSKRINLQHFHSDIEYFFRIKSNKLHFIVMSNPPFSVQDAWHTFWYEICQQLFTRFQSSTLMCYKHMPVVRKKLKLVYAANYADWTYSENFLEVQIKDDSSPDRDLRCQYRYQKPEKSGILVSLTCNPAPSPSCAIETMECLDPNPHYLMT